VYEKCKLVEFVEVVSGVALELQLLLSFVSSK